jgi:2-methylcitrate dehydratase PrpD
MTDSKGITERLARFVAETTYASLPTEAVAAAKRAMLDYVGVTIAGSQEPVGKLVAKSVKRPGCTPRAVVVGAGFRTSVSNAAFANATMAHALDYDDVGTNSDGFPVAVHLTTVLMSAIMSLGEDVKASGEDIIAAYVLGYEVASQLASAMGQDYGDDLGWHPTPTLGVVGAAASCARLLGLDAAIIATAISISASYASGLRQNFGTMMKSLQVGNAAQSGVGSAQLASNGFSAAPDALEGRYGFIHAFSGGKGYDLSKITGTLGKTFQVVSPGPAVKLFPCCASAHGPLNALFSMMSKHHIPADKVAGIDVIVPFDPPRSLIYDNPQNALEGKFSLQYLLAAALLDHKIGLDTFTVDKIKRPEAAAFFKNIRMFRKPGLEGKPSWEPPEYVVTVKMVDGQSYSEEIKAPFIAPVRIPTWQEMSGKYRDCASLLLSEQDVENSLQLLNDVDKLKNISPLADIIIKPK